MKRSGPLRRYAPLKQSAPAQGQPSSHSGSAARRRSTGPTASIRAAVIDRAGGRCEVCGALLDRRPYSIHHRQARGMGGTRNAAANSPSNLMALCGSGTTGCHGWIESHREESYERGYLVRHTDNPATTPVLLSDGRMTFLTERGGYSPR